jgi:hypothetical protein
MSTGGNQRHFSGPEDIARFSLGEEKIFSFYQGNDTSPRGIKRKVTKAQFT